MRLATVDTGIAVEDFIVLQTENDIEEYQKLVDSATGDDIVDMMHSTTPHDHYAARNHSVMQAAISIAYLKAAAGASTNPFLEADPIRNNKLLSFYKYIDDCETILVRKSGSYMFLHDEHKVLSEVDFDYKYDNYKLFKGTEAIILENDPSWDMRGVMAFYPDFLKEGTFSYINSLRECMASGSLDRILKEFADMGGKKAQVFTTAQDMHQMKTYAKSVHLRGLDLEVILSIENDANRSEIEKWKNTKLL